MSNPKEARGEGWRTLREATRRAIQSGSLKPEPLQLHPWRPVVAGEVIALQFTGEWMFVPEEEPWAERA